MIDLDTNSPMTFTEFRDNNLSYNNINELSELYRDYLVEYRDNKISNTNTDNNYTSNLYKEYLKNINISNLDSDIKDFLNVLDYDDIYELDIVSHYSTSNIQNQISNLRDYRDELKNSKIKNNLKASREGIELYLKNFIIRLLKQDDFLKEDTSITEIDIEEIANKLSIKFIRYVTQNTFKTESNSVPDVYDRIDFDKRIKEASKKTIQPLRVSHNGEYRYLKTSSDKILSVNVPFTDPLRLPSRFFANEQKTLDNLTISLNSKLYEKYLGTDIYYLSGNGVDYTFRKILTAENKSSYNNRYHPIVANHPGDLIKSDYIPFQLSYSNSGLALSLSKNLTYNIDVSAVSGEYLVSDPSKIQTGVGFRTKKTSSPINYSAENKWIKNNEIDSINVFDNLALKGYGYQSRESSFDYSFNINRKYDEVSFWSGTQQNIWKNEDVYKRTDLNSYPEQERFQDLLISNKTAFTIKNDLYGNEYIMLKSISPKRYSGTSYISSVSSETADLTSCSVYDGLYFDDVLSAISAADPSTYDSLTAVYDTVIYNDISGCEGLDGFFAPLSTAECSSISGDDLVDGGPMLNHPCDGSFLVENRFNKNTNILFYSVELPETFTTTYELSTFNNPSLSTISLYNQNYVETGEIYIRDIGTQKVYTLYEKLSGILTKLPTSIQSDVSSNNIVNFDVVGNTLYFQTSSNTFTESYTYDGENFTLAKPSISLIL